jgi:hypothetical protein
LTALLSVFIHPSIWTIFRELMLVLAKVTIFEILPLKYNVKRIFSVVVRAVCALYFNGKISKRVTLARTNMSSLKMVHMD